MDFLGKIIKSKKSPKELVASAKSLVSTISVEVISGTVHDKDSKGQKAIVEISKILVEIRDILYGNTETDTKKQEVNDLAREFYQTDLLFLLLNNLEYLEFEARKDVEKIFTNLLKLIVNGRYPTVEYLCGNPKILDIMINGYNKPEIYLIDGNMLRECFKHESLCKIVLTSEDFYQFFRFIDLENFDVAVDAFGTFKEVLSNRQKTALVPDFLSENFDKFFGAYNKLLASNLYVTKRQSLKLLSEILIDRSNSQVRDKYLAQVDNLKIIMNLLVNKAQGIKIEAYNVFKLFVYNPKKSDGIKNILLLNRDKLVSYLTEFKVKDDVQFEEEKEKILKKIQDL